MDEVNLETRSSAGLQLSAEWVTVVGCALTMQALLALLIVFSLVLPLLLLLALLFLPLPLLLSLLFLILLRRVGLRGAGLAACRPIRGAGSDLREPGGAA